VRLAGDAIDERTERGERVSGQTLLLLLNADEHPISFALPPPPPGRLWEEVVDSSRRRQSPVLLAGGKRYRLKGRSSAVLVLQREKRRRRADATVRVAALSANAAPAEAADAAPRRA
jgi:isoamylase